MTKPTGGSDMAGVITELTSGMIPEQHYSMKTRRTKLIA
jgi:hypothetical protein